MPRPGGAWDTEGCDFRLVGSVVSVSAAYAAARIWFQPLQVSFEAAV